MAPTIDFREIVQERALREPEFREMLFTSGVQCLLDGEINVAKVVLRDYIETTMGYEKLGKLIDAPAGSLVCMFGKDGTPSAGDLLEVVCSIQRHEGVRLEVHAVR